MFLVVMSVWLGKVVMNWMSAPRETGNIISRSKAPKPKGMFLSAQGGPVLGWYFGILFLFIVWGALNGYLQGNNLDNLFFDFNAWLYFGILFPVAYVFKENKERVNEILQNLFIVFTAAISWLIVKTLFLLFVFSHNMIGMNYELYRWLRVTGVGEVTMMDGGFYRIFFQGYVYVIVGLFVFLSLWVYYWLVEKKISLLVYWFIGLLGCVSLTIISFSRSFWVGLGVGLLFYWFIILLVYWRKWRVILWQVGVLVIAGMLSMALIFTIVRFPYPRSSADFSASMLSERVTMTTSEAGASSRWNLLPVLIEEIKKAPILGKGFGATITYFSSDPRVLERSPTGEYTTYAFEWGWLDIWLKLGLLGLLAYAALLLKIFIYGFNRIQNGEFRMQNLIIISLLAGLAMIIVTNFFSPYLNHPLGIGYVVLVGVLLTR